MLNFFKKNCLVKGYKKFPPNQILLLDESESSKTEVMGPLTATAHTKGQTYIKGLYDGYTSHNSVGMQEFKGEKALFPQPQEPEMRSSACLASTLERCLSSFSFITLTQGPLFS